jgi:acyl dehydratase
VPIDPTAAGLSTGPVTSSWTEDDCMRYALSVGACLDGYDGPELRYTTENTAGIELAALPSMATVLGGVLTAPSPLDHIGDYDRKMTVHGSVEVTLHRPLPTRASVVSTLTVEGIHDKRSGALVRLAVDAADEHDGSPMFTTVNGIFIRGEGGWGGDGGPAWSGPAVPARDPDESVTQRTRHDQPLLYRLNGDRNPLHSDPARARAAGFERPILHGLCTLGFAVRAVLHAVGDDEPSRVGGFGCRFVAPVLPGDELETQIWRTDDGAAFRTCVAGREVLGAGYVRMR